MDLVDLIRNSDKIRYHELSELYFKQECGRTIYSYLEKNYREGNREYMLNFIYFMLQILCKFFKKLA